VESTLALNAERFKGKGKDMQLTVPAAVTGIVLLVLVPVSLNSQTPAAGTFEVASITRNDSGETRMMIAPLPGARFQARNAHLAQLLQFAYGLRDYQLVGGPDWMRSERFDITAIAAGGGTPDIPSLVRSLLADRFKLVARRDTQQQPVYLLTLAAADGRTGPQLRTSNVDCAAFLAELRKSAGPLPAPGSRPMCTMLTTPDSITGASRTMAQLGAALTARVGRHVIDRTGLTGAFDFELRWTPDLQAAGPLDPASAAPRASDGPSMFTAVQEQLGLRLQPATGPVDVVVVDGAERPTEN
jgi:uncharacterized protein (TIGR03435 family)